MPKYLLILLAICACGGAEHTATPDARVTDGAIAVDGGGDGGVGPHRLHITGRTLHDGGQLVQLGGVNLRDNLLGDDPPNNPTNCITDCSIVGNQCSQASAPLLTVEEADTLATTLSLNFVRLRISFEGINRDDCDPDGTNLSRDLRAKLDDAVALLAARHVWILLEMRTSDAVANRADLYTPGSADFVAYQKAWTYLATRYATVDYIAGYGILAEPSADHPFTDDLVVGKLTDFQHAMMTTIDAHDHATPFFIGPAYNYDTMGYRWDAYATAFPEFAGRLIYEVNVLMPKPWIGDGTDGAAPVGYPILPAATPAALTAALLMPTGGFQVPLNDEKIFSKQRVSHFALLMSKPFLTWYLEFARGFAEAHQVPMIVDQFGATARDAGGLAVAGQLAYEQDVIDVVEAAGMGWSRWIYAVSSVKEQPRDILHNDAVKAFYQGIGAARPGP